MLLGLGLCTSAWSQDPQYTQFYSNPLFLNPGFAGSSGDARLSVNYRMQWPGLDVSYNTYSLSYDHFVASINSGFGFYISRDDTQTSNASLSNTSTFPGQNTLPISTTAVSGFYSYLIPLSDKWSIQAGLQAGFGMRRTDNSFVFESDLIGGGGSENVIDGSAPRNYFDFSSGAVLYSRTLWVGVSASHINQPNQSLLVNGEDQLPMKLSLQAGYRLDLNPVTDKPADRERSIMPVLMYRMQGQSDQMDVGIYAVFEPLIAGIWYRGIPFKAFDDIQGDSDDIWNANQFRNTDAVAFLLGFKYKDFSIGYSYDVTTSQIGFANTAGSHEISMTYHFSVNSEYDNNRPRYKRFGRIYCPNPWKSYQKMN